MKKLAIIVIYAGFAFSCQSQKINVQDWNEDIDFYRKTLEEKHIDLYHTITKQDFDSEIQKIKNQLHLLTDYQVRVELMKLTHRIGNGESDGHTSVPLWNTERNYFPIELFDFGNELRVIKTIDAYEHLLGKKLMCIDGVPVEEVSKKIASITPFVENEQSLMHRICAYIRSSELLFAFGITKDQKKAAFTFLGDDNPSEIIVIEPVSLEKFDDSFFNKKLPLGSAEFSRPVWAKLENFWFKLLNDKKTVYIKYSRFPSYQEMEIIAPEILDFINKNLAENLIIDLRENYGGTTFVGVKLAEHLILAESVNWYSGVYVLTDRGTYSAAMVNTVQFRQLLNAKIVGEPTGGNPNSYQDLGMFNLPNSNLLVTYSKRLFRLQKEKTQGVQPDVLIVPKWENYKKGVDEPIVWILKDLKKKYLTQNKRH